MATLTWQDVAGQVRAPDYSEASELMTRGLGQISTAVQAPERLRQEKLDREMKGLLIRSEMNNQTSNMIDKIDTKLKNEAEKKDMKEFSKIQSFLEAGFQDAANQGKSFDEYLKGSKEYSSLSEGAKAYGASRLSDAYYRGQQAREQRLAREQNDRMQEAQLALQRQNLAESRAARAEASRSRKIADDISQMRLDELKRAEADRKFLSTPLGRLTERVGTNYNDAIGKGYENKTWGEIAKGSGIKGYSEYREGLNSLNARRVEQGKRALPEGAAKSLLATQIGKNTGIPSWFNEVDGFDIDGQLSIIADQYDASLREADVLTKFKTLQEKGISFSDDDVLAELARANPPADKRKPAAAPTTMDIWKIARK